LRKLEVDNLIICVRHIQILRLKVKYLTNYIGFREAVYYRIVSKYKGENDGYKLSNVI